MSSTGIRLPKYRLPRGSGQAIVTLDGKSIYLGRHGTAASRHAYDRVTAEYLASGRRLPATAGPSDLTVAEVIAAYWRHASTYYVKDGRPTSELACVKSALRPLKALYGDTPAAAFGPLALEAVRATMVAAALSRGVINKHVGRIKAMFRWATAQELVPGNTYHALAALPGLKRGRSEARETEPVKPVALAWVHKTLPFLPPAVAAMVKLQALTGMRSGEAVIMRGRDLNMAGAVWQFKPASHKTEHHGHERVIDLGPRAQAVIRPWLKPDLETYLFSPREGEAARNAAKREARLSPLTPSALARRRRVDRGRRGGRPPGERYPKLRS